MEQIRHKRSMMGEASPTKRVQTSVPQSPHPLIKTEAVLDVEKQGQLFECIANVFPNLGDAEYETLVRHMLTEVMKICKYLRYGICNGRRITVICVSQNISW